MDEHVCGFVFVFVRMIDIMCLWVRFFGFEKSVPMCFFFFFFLIKLTMYLCEEEKKEKEQRRRKKIAVGVSL